MTDEPLFTYVGARGTMEILPYGTVERELAGTTPGSVAGNGTALVQAIEEASWADAVPAPASYDATAAAAARDEAMERVEEHADDAVLAAADTAVKYLASTRDEFTIDAVQYLLDQQGLAFREPKALGPVMRRAALAGLIEGTDRWVNSVRVSNHRRPVRVWRSLIRG